MFNIFNNRIGYNYEEIKTYSPSWFLEWRELDANLRYAGWTLDLCAYWLERLIANQFPMTADEETIRMFEKLFDIEVEPGSTLDERRRIVAAYFSGGGKLCRTSIKQMIDTYTGCDSDIYWVGGNQLRIRIFPKNGTDVSYSLRRFYSILHRRMPAHIAFYICCLLAVVVHEENVVSSVTYRISLPWWSDVLDGMYDHEGMVRFDAARPPFFIPRFKIKIDANAPVMNMHSCNHRFDIIENNQIELKKTYRISFPWWSDVLDGAYANDGDVHFNAVRPPFFIPKYIYKITEEQRIHVRRTSCRFEVLNENGFIFNMYDQKATERTKLDGTYILDGTLRLDARKGIL